jgi:hypothetical protein
MTRGTHGALRRHGAVTHVLREAARGISRTKGEAMKKNNATEYFHVWRRRAMGALGVLMIAGSALALTAAPAAACNGTGFSTTCLEITCRDDALCDIHVGIDIFMSRQEAEDIIAASPRQELFTVLLLAHDHNNCSQDTSGLTELDIADGWPQAGDGSLSAEFNKTVGRSLLDEDRGSEQDELCAWVILHNKVVGGDFVHYSNVVEDHYE